MSSTTKPFQVTSNGVFMERHGAGWNDEKLGHYPFDAQAARSCLTVRGYHAVFIQFGEKRLQISSRRGNFFSAGPDQAT